LRHSQILKAHPNVEFSFSDFKVLEDGQEIIPSKFSMAPPHYWAEAGRRIVADGWLFDRNIAPNTIRWHPIFPSATVVARRLAIEVGGFNLAMRGLAPEDGEFTLRCLYKATVAAIPEPTVLIRRHGGNATGDDLRTLIDEITALGWIKKNHAEAQPFFDIIDSEIRARRLTAVHGAFAAKRHDLVRELLVQVPRHERTLGIRLKSALAQMPDSLGSPLNEVLQRLSETVKQTHKSSRAPG
jgi:hypothetical protein